MGEVTRLHHAVRSGGSDRVTPVFVFAYVAEKSGLGSIRHLRVIVTSKLVDACVAAERLRIVQRPFPPYRLLLDFLTCSERYSASLFDLMMSEIFWSAAVF